MKVKCSVCGKVVSGRVPHMGTGDTAFPRWHKNWSGVPCDGRFEDVKWINETADASTAS